MSTRRHKAREVALQMLFQKDLNPDVAPDLIREQMQEALNDEQLCRFAWSLYAGVCESLSVIDARIAVVAANWTVDRMPTTDRNAIRLGAFELIYTDTPPRVAIDEALELAKSFGSANSSAFVNGILDRLIPREKRTPIDFSETATEGEPETAD
ncbi:MAG: transcription antitermination factor NusB [Planctomycetes bacterium]|nr:transcription antitermination factor NusB [Planctomycetota bacterium]